MLINIPQSKAFLVSQKALIVFGEQLLILRGTELDDRKQGLWELPGGLLEIDEDLHSGLIREVKEETGLSVSVNSLATIWDHWVSDFTFRDGRTMDVRILEVAYFCSLQNGEVKLSSEHTQYKWVSRSEAAQYQFAATAKNAVEYWLQIGKMK